MCIVKKDVGREVKLFSSQGETKDIFKVTERDRQEKESSKIKEIPFGNDFEGPHVTLTLVVGAELLLKLFFGWLWVWFGPRLLYRGFSLFHTLPGVMATESCLYPSCSRFPFFIRTLLFLLSLFFSLVRIFRICLLLSLLRLFLWSFLRLYFRWATFCVWDIWKFINNY